LAAGVFGLIVFAAMVAAGNAWDRSFPSTRFDTPYRDGVPDVNREWYLASEKDVLDYDVFYHGWWGTPQALRRADVLFLGNSRAMYAFRAEYFQPYLDVLGVRGYNMALPSGADAFPLAIIRKYDLHPKVVVVNSDAFFANDLTSFGAWATERSDWESWRLYYEYVASWTARKYLHLLLPPWREYLLDRRYQVMYRSASTGSVRLVVGEDDQRLMTPVSPPPISAADEATADGMVPSQLRNLQVFREEVAARGAAMVLTLVPYGDSMPLVLTRKLSAISGVPFIEEWPVGLEGAAGSHMNARSSKRFLDMLMPRLLAEPAVKVRLLGQPALSRQSSDSWSLRP